jgi:GNAT superfamily N-acetyltransferase
MMARPGVQKCAIVRAVKQAYEFTVRELRGPDVTLAYAAMFELRGQSLALATAETFVSWISAHAGSEGFRLAGAFLPGQTEAAAVIGFRLLTTLHGSRTLYVDDLSTRSRARGRGLATSLLAWAEAEARRLNCSHLHLDSGVQRFPAHRLYLKYGFDITCHHFGKDLK